MAKIKDIPSMERPREKALLQGIKFLSDSELLALIIQSGIKNKSVLEICIELIANFHGINNVFSATYEQLIKCAGISKAKALQIVAFYEIMQRINKNTLLNNKQKYKITSSLDVYNYLHLHMENLNVEYLIVLYLNVHNCIIFEEINSIGNDNMAICNSKIICKNAIEKLASKIIICHNHPTGNCKPSSNDFNFFYMLSNALDYIQVRLLDHIIIGKNEYYSIKENKKNIISK